MVKLKNGVFKKSLALFLAVLMFVTGMAGGFNISAFAAAQGEERFCSDKMNSLPTNDVAFFRETTKLPNLSELNQSRFESIVHTNGSSEYVVVNERACYNEIVKVVKKIQQSVKNGNNLNMGGEDYYKYVSLPEKMRLTEAIYRWVAENIYYDFETYDIVEKDSNGSQASWKPQDAYFVFQKRIGVCEGYARLANLMLRIAGIPCMYVSSICGPDNNCAHAFNAVYVDDCVNNRRGWTLIDPTWASPHGSDGNNPNSSKSVSGTTKFSANCFNIFNRRDNYLKELYNNFASYISNAANLSGGLVMQLNRMAPQILKNLNQKYPDGSHFKKINFYSVAGSLRLQYEADVKAQDVKQYNASAFKSCVSELTGKSEMSFCVWPAGQADAANGQKNQVSVHGLWFTDSCFDRINDSSKQNRVKSYLSALKQICSNAILSNLGNIERSVKNLNDEVNAKLRKLNNAYRDVAGFENLSFTLKRERNQANGAQGVYNVLMLKCKSALSEDEITQRLDNSFSNDDKFLKEQKAKENQKFFKEFFPAFYNPDLSIEQANKKVIKHAYHKLFAFEVSQDFWEQKINFPRLKETSHEGNAQIEPTVPPDNAPSYYVPQELVKYGLEVAIPCNVKVLVLTGNEMVNLDDALSLEKIVGRSNLYIIEDGNLYEKVNGQKGRLIFGRTQNNGYGNYYDYNYNNNNYGGYDNNTYDNYNNNSVYENTSDNYNNYGGYDNNYNNTYDNYAYQYNICTNRED